MPELWTFGTMKSYPRNSADRGRLLCSVLCLAGLALYLVCLFRHTCMGGHLCREHGPYTIWPYANDAVWLMLLPAVAVMCWWSNICGRHILSLALLFLLATNVELITGILPWLGFYPVAIWISLLAVVGITLGGLFVGGRAGKSAALQGDSGRTKHVMLVGVGVAVCVMCFALGYLSTERQRELAEQRHCRARVAILLSAYKTVASTNWLRARTELGDELLSATRDYQEQFGIEKGTNRIARMFSEAVAIADAVEREAKNATITNAPTVVAPAVVGGQVIDPATGLPTDHVEKENE